MLSEKVKIVNMGPPVDVNGSGLDGDYVSLKNYKWATIVIQLGVTGAAGKITVEEAKAVDGTGAGLQLPRRGNGRWRHPGGINGHFGRKRHLDQHQ